MSRSRRFLIAIPILLFFPISCNNNKHKNELQFYYYPEKNVYFDPGKKSFLYSLNGAKSWNTFTDANAAEPANIGEKIVVFSKTADVYRDNENHRKVYGGRLYNVHSNDSSSIAVGPEATEKKVVQKRRSTAARRSGGRKSNNSFSGFINKIFGKSR